MCRVLQGCKGVPTYLAALEVQGKLYLVMQVSALSQAACNRLQQQPGADSLTGLRVAVLQQLRATSMQWSIF